MSRIDLAMVRTRPAYGGKYVSKLCLRHQGAERYAQEHGFAFCRLYTEDVEEAGKTANTLFNDQGFIQLTMNNIVGFKQQLESCWRFTVPHGNPKVRGR